MRLADLTQGWGLAGTGTLLLVAGLVGWLCRSRRSSGTAHEEGDEQRKRRKETVYGVASYTLLFCCAAVAAALSFHGLVGFGRQNLNLTGGWEYLVPFGLDGAAMFCSVLAVREASHGDAALGSRILVWLFAGAAAWFNWVHAPRGAFHAGAPQFFAGMSISAAVLFDRALKQTRRAALRDQGLVPRPLPQIRIVRWLRAPRETFAAWSLMLLEGVRSLDEAVDEVREDKRQSALRKERQRQADRRERAQLRALKRQNRRWLPGGRQVDVAMLPTGERDVGQEQDQQELDPAGAEPAELTTRQAAGALPGPERATGASRDMDEAKEAAVPSRAERASRRRTLRSVPKRKVRKQIDLTAEDDTQSVPRLDSLEKKLKDLEQQFT